MNRIGVRGVSVGVLSLVAAPIALLAHAVVFPKASIPGAYERYVLRVPNEKAVATTRVELRVPAGVRVISFADTPGWRLETKLDSANAIAGAVWTGRLAPKRFVEFPFMAVNPKTAVTIHWPAVQTYADGTVVEWTGPDSSKSPASSTQIIDLPQMMRAAPVSAVSGAPSWPAWLALVIAVIALGLAIRRPSGNASA
jgi:uncharacterized protein YcnI